MGVTEGVSSDGSSGPTIYSPAQINSEIFEFLRSSKYTPSVSHSLSSSLREGAGNELYHSMCRPKTATLRAIFIAPTKAQKFLHFTIHRGTLPQSALRAASSLREGAGMAVPFNVPPGNRNVAGDFHRPYETLMILDFTIHRTTLPQLRCAQQLPQRGSRERAVPFNVPLRNRKIAGDFHRLYEAQKFLHFTIHQTIKHNFFQNGRRNSYESC